MSDATLTLAAEQVKAALDKQFNKPRKGFNLSLSQVGRPLCQLQMARDGVEPEPMTAATKMVMIYGDMVEAAVKAILTEAGVAYDGAGEVTLDLPSGVIRGEFDMILRDETDTVWDVKSASGWAVRNKWSKGFDAVYEGDSFGYVHQLVGYAAGTGLKPGGWIVVNKESGDWLVVEFPDDEELIDKVLDDMDERVRFLQEKRPFVRTCEDVEETWYGKPTGNRVLQYPCSFCPYKHSCWPGLTYAANPKSKAKEPKMQWYTYLAGNETPVGQG